MANRDNPIGFRPANGIGVTHQYMEFVITTGNGTNIFVGDVMDLDGTSITPAAADANVSAIGVCTQIKDTNGVSIGHPNSAVSTKYLPLSTAGIVVVALANPSAIFIAQDDGGTALTAADVGVTTDHIAGTGDTTTATSRHELNSTTGQGQFRILGLVKDPSNSWGANADIYCTFNETALSGSGEASV